MPRLVSLFVQVCGTARNPLSGNERQQCSHLPLTGDA
jgi:hypothetical protein